MRLLIQPLKTRDIPAFFQKTTKILRNLWNHRCVFNFHLQNRPNPHFLIKPLWFAVVARNWPTQGFVLEKIRRTHVHVLRQKCLKEISKKWITGVFKIASRSLWGNSSWIIFQIKRMKRLILTKTYQNLNSFTAYRSEFFENPSFKRPVLEPIRPKFQNFHLCNTFKKSLKFWKFSRLRLAFRGFSTRSFQKSYSFRVVLSVLALICAFLRV